MAERDTRLEEALRKAAAAGDTVAAQRFATAIRDRRADEGQQAPPTTPDTLAPSAPVEDVDPLANVPTEINGVPLTPELRQAVLEGRQIKDPKERRLMAARIAGRLAAQSEDGNFADDLSRGQFGAGLRGFGAGLFGLGDIAAAGGTFIGSQFSDNELTFGEALEAQREFRRALEEDFPITSTVGEVAGALTGGGGVGLGLKATAKVVAPRVGQAIQAATTLQRGQRGRNVLRLAGAGAIGGAITEGVLEGDPTSGAAAGALGGPLGAGFVKAAGLIGRGGKAAIDKLMSDPAAKGIKALAKSLGEDADEIARRFLEFEAVMGSKPAIADLANPQAVAELRDMIAERSGATAIAREAGEAATQRRAGEVAEAIGGARVTTTATAQTAARTRQAEKQFAEAEADPIDFTSREVQDIIFDPDVRRIMPPTLKRRIDDIFADVPEGEAATLTGLDVNDLRKALRKAAKGATGADRVFGEIANELEDVARKQSPAFGRAIDEFARRSRTIEGIEAGRRGVTARTGEFEAGVEAAAPEVRAGIRAGVRSEITDVARESATRAASLSRSLAEDSGLVQRLKSILKPAEVERLQSIGRVQARSAENIAALAPGVRASEQAELRSAVKDTISSMVAAGGSTGGAFKASIMQRILTRITRLPENVVENLARDAFDPAKTTKVLAALRRAQISEEAILDMFSSAVAGGTVAAQTGDQ